MTLYIEYVMLDNLVFDKVILDFMQITLKFKTKIINKLLFCFIGVISAIFLPFIQLTLFVIPYKILTAVFMVFVLRKYKKIKTFLCYLAMLFAYTFLLGGVLLGVFNMLNIDYSMSNTLMYSFDLPISVVIIILMLTIYFIKRILLIIKSKLKTANYLYDIRIVCNKKELKAIGFLDTGNKVSIDGKSVSIMSINLFLKLFSEVSIEDLMLGKLNLNNFKSGKYIDISGISRQVKCLSFEVDTLQIDKRELHNVIMAVAMKNFESFDCILNNNLIEV